MVGDADGVAFVGEVVPEGADEVVEALLGDFFADFLREGEQGVVEFPAAVVGGEVVEGGGEFGGHGRSRVCPASSHRQPATVRARLQFGPGTGGKTSSARRWKVNDTVAGGTAPPGTSRTRAKPRSIAAPAPATAGKVTSQPGWLWSPA